MTVDVIKYSGIYAKKKALAHKLLTNNEMIELTKSEDVKSFALSLMGKPAYAEHLQVIEKYGFSRIPVERSLLNSLYSDFSSICNFVTDASIRKYLGRFFSKYEVGVLKALLRRLFDSRDNRNALPNYGRFLSRHMQFNVEKILNANTLQAFIETLSDTEYHGVLKKINRENPTLFDFELQLDIYWAIEIWKCQEMYLKSINYKSVKKINGMDIDLQNIMRIYRAKQYYVVDKNIIYTYLTPINYKLSKSDIDSLVMAKNNDEFMGAISATSYKNVFKSMKFGELEKHYYLFMKKIYEDEERLNPFSIAPIYAYIFEKGLEIRNLTTLLECIRYGLPYEKSLEKLILDPVKVV